MISHTFFSTTMTGNKTGTLVMVPALPGTGPEKTLLIIPMDF
jgi:hypothetical protein